MARLARPALPILAKLLVAYLVPTLVLFAAFGIFVHESVRAELEAELGRRLAAVAASAAPQVRGSYLVDLAPGDESARAWQNTRRKLEAVRAETGVAAIYVFRPDHTSLCDTRDGVPIGEEYYNLELDRHELARVFERGESLSSVLFTGKDGASYKAGYAPVHASESEPTIVAALAVEAPAAYFARLEALRGQLLRSGAGLAALVVVISVVVATLLTRPIRRLASAAARIGRGDLTVPVAPAGGDEIGRLAATLDEMREALRARDERMRMMLAGIAHEVRNPLAGIELYAGILRDELEGDTDRRAHVARIERELGHLKTVVTDFLEYARRPKPELVPLDVAALLSEVHELAAPEAETAGVALQLETAVPARVLGDATQVRRALLNLVRNAIQATSAGGAVTLGARADGRGRVLVQVADTGKGIEAEHLARIFTPFFTTKEKGTGLGLAFAREIAADHRGTLRVDSELGRGTTFTLDVPEHLG